MTDTIDYVIIGAGVIGLSLARGLAMKGCEVLLLERHGSIGVETSSRNSGVIHAGMYYPQRSLKAQLCTSGRDMLYAFCDVKGIEYKKIGKLIVATNENQYVILQKILNNGLKNGVADLRLLNAGEVKTLEPELNCIAAIHSPSSGIIDVHAYMLALQGEAENYGVQCAFRTEVEKVETVRGGFAVHTGGTDATTILCKHLINAAGLQATRLAESIDRFPDEWIPELRLAKGNYFTHTKRVPFTRLIYPVPEPGGLGIHLTLDLGGQARFGPDVEWIDKVDYHVDPSRAPSFYDAIRTYWPQLEDNMLSAGYAGIRPKMEINGKISSDFIIQGHQEHGIENLINLFGIESPGLTSSLAIANYAIEKLCQHRT